MQQHAAEFTFRGDPQKEIARLEELRGVKDELKRLEDEHGDAERARDEALTRVPNPPHESAPDGDAEEDALEVSRPLLYVKAREPTREGRELECGERNPVLVFLSTEAEPTDTVDALCRAANAGTAP